MARSKPRVPWAREAASPLNCRYAGKDDSAPFTRVFLNH
jgi:hypothetical protein